MKAIVCGGREYNNKDILFEVLDRVDPDDVIEGGAHGADALACLWAVDRDRVHVQVNAEWSKHGKGAGPIRNSVMLGYNPDVVIAFPGGRGTANMIKQAKEAGVPVNRVVISWKLEEE